MFELWRLWICTMLICVLLWLVIGRWWPFSSCAVVNRIPKCAAKLVCQTATTSQSGKKNELSQIFFIKIGKFPPSLCAKVSHIKAVVDITDWLSDFLYSALALQKLTRSVTVLPMPCEKKFFFDIYNILAGGLPSCCVAWCPCSMDTAKVVSSDLQFHSPWQKWCACELSLRTKGYAKLEGETATTCQSLEKFCKNNFSWAGFQKNKWEFHFADFADR